MARLGDICEILNGFAFKSEQYVDSGVRIIRIANVQKGYIEDNSPVYYPAKSNEAQKYALYNDDLLISLTGNVGRVALLEEKYLPAALNQRVACLRIKDSVKLSKKFLYHILNSDYFEEMCIASSKGVAQKNMSTEWLKEYNIPLPSAEKQSQIVNTLDKLDTLIFVRKQQLAKLDELVKARFVEMFGDPFNNRKWNVQKLRNISVSISDGSNVDQTYYQEKGDVLFLRIQNVWFNEFRLDDSVYISEEINNEYHDTSLHYGDLLITKIGRYYTRDSSLGRVSVYLGENDKANYSNNIMRVRLTDEVCSQFVNILMNLEDYNRYIRGVSVGGTDKRALSKAIVGDFPIIMPPKELQIEFLEFAEQTGKSKLTIQQSLDKLEVLKKSLMQEYFG